MNFKIKTEDEQRLDHIRELVETCEESLMKIEGPSGVGMLKEQPEPKARAPPRAIAIRVNHVGKYGNINAKIAKYGDDMKW